MEGALLGLFLVSACFFAFLLGHPDSPLAASLGGPLARRALMGVAMGGTAVSLIYSPWGKRSGAHLNPAVTLAFLRLGRVAPVDAFFYAAAQFTGAILAVWILSLAAGQVLADPSVSYVTTRPRDAGFLAAFLAELAISTVQMFVVLTVSSVPAIARATGCVAAALVALYITFEEPLSGMSMNPARTFGPALVSGLRDGLWIYFTAPPLGMLLATELHRRLRRAHPVLCAKLHHQNHYRCIFRCGLADPPETCGGRAASNSPLSTAVARAPSRTAS